MQRTTFATRTQWVENIVNNGFRFQHTNYTPDEQVWANGVAYEVTPGEVDAVKEATRLIYRMCLSAVDHVVGKDELLTRMAIPRKCWPAIRNSWRDQDIDTFDSFDFMLTKSGELKLIDINSDIPSGLLEAAAFQNFWLDDLRINTNSYNLTMFNTILDDLIDVFKDYGAKYVAGNMPVHFTASAADPRLQDIAVYLQALSHEAGINGQYIDLENIGWNGSEFKDLDEKTISSMFKVYPWEWMVREEFGAHLLSDPCDVNEPAWKLVLGNKGLLAVLWELYPGHKNLLATHWEPSSLGGTYVKKAKTGREGYDLQIFDKGVEVLAREPNIYDVDGYIFQAVADTIQFNGTTPVLSSWVIGGKSSGLGLREGGANVNSRSPFVPHFIR